MLFVLSLTRFPTLLRFLLQACARVSALHISRRFSLLLTSPLPQGRQMVVWLNTFSKRTPRMSITLAWMYPQGDLLLLQQLGELLQFHLQGSGLGSTYSNLTALGLTEHGPGEALSEVLSVSASAWPSGCKVSRSTWGTRPSPIRGPQYAISPQNSYGGGQGKIPNTSEPCPTPGPIPGTPGNSWKLRQVQGFTKPGSSPPDSLPPSPLGV